MSRARESAGRHGGAGEPLKLAALGKQFARFRKEHPRGTRIPAELRVAALALLREVAPADLYRSCGITFGQVMVWKEAGAQSPEAAGARVFSVVDEEPAPRVASRTAPAAAAPELELRLGPWSVSVRLVELAGRD